MRPKLARFAMTILVGSLIAAPAVPAFAGGSATATRSASSLAASAFEELGAPASVVEAFHPDSPQRIYPYIRPVGDLDGDGVNDVVSLTREGDYPQAVVVVTARRGTDGTQLFSRSLGTDGVVTLLESGPVGADGSTGLLLGIYSLMAVGGVQSGGSGVTTGPYGERPFSYETVAVNVSLNVVALGATGSVLWQRPFTDGRFAYTGLTLAVVQDLPILSGSLQAVPGSPRDVAVTVYDRTPTTDNSQDDALHVQMIDGRTGQTVATRTLDIDNTEAPVAVAPDLDGDGLDDLTLQLLPAAGTTPVNTPTLVGLRGTDGAELYRNGTLPLSREMELNLAGDLTGDHITDFTLSKPFLRDRNAPAQRVVLVNGKTGAALLNSDADTARPLGDIDGDGAAEVLLSSAFNSNTVAEVDHQAVDAVGGVIWDESFSVTGVADAASMLLSSPGDVDGDGVDEIAHQLTVRKDTSSTDVIEDLRIISGRTGRSIRDTGPVGYPLGGSLDGNGDDLAAVSSFGDSAVDVSAVNGRTGAAMFTKRLRPRGDVTRISRVDGADVTGDGILDLIVNTEALVEEGPEIPGVSSPEPAFVWDGFVVNGRTGALVWSTDSPGQPVEPDLNGTVSAAAPYSWNGPNATGVNVQVTGEVECRTEPTALCQDILVEISNPPAQGDASATRAASVVLDQFGPVVEPATDFDLYVHESDQLGTIGPLVDQSFSAGGNPVDGPEGERVTLQVTTTNQQPSHFYLLRVVYYRSVESGYRGIVSLA